MKPFKGIIRDWYRGGDVVCGRVEFHSDMVPLCPGAILRDDLVLGGPMHTSRVEKIEDRGAFSLLETRNSFYVLVKPQTIAVADIKDGNAS